MKKKIYAIQDIKADQHNNPFLAENDDVCRRLVMSAVQNDSGLSQFPEDYRVFCVGEYDTTRGTIKPESNPRWVFNLTECVENPNKMEVVK